MLNMQVHYFVDPNNPKTVGIWVAENLPYADPPATPIDFETINPAYVPRNAYELGSIIAQGLGWYQGVGVQWSSADCIVTTDEDPDEELDSFSQAITGIAGNGQIGVGVKNRVIGLKAKTQVSKRASVLAVGFANEGTVAYTDGAPLNSFASMTRLAKLRVILNGLTRWAPSAVQGVQTGFVRVNDYPFEVYHSTRSD